MRKLAKKISPCLCRGSLKYIHPECMDIWIKKSLFLERMYCKHEGNSKYSVRCEICHGNIKFKMSYRTECKSCSDVKEKVDEERGKFICLVMAVMVFFILAGSSISVALTMFDEGEKRKNIWIMIFSVLIMLAFLLILIRCFHLLISTYFVGKNYNIGKYEEDRETHP